MEDNSGLKAYITEVLLSGKLKSVERYFQRYLIWDYVDKNDYSGAVITADQIRSSASDDKDLTCEMIYEKGLIYKYYLNDTETANAVFAEINKNYPTHVLNKFAVAQLNPNQNEYSQDTTTISEPASVDNYNITSNPNPFNPTTNISYTLPAAGFVKLTVYDILGREVAQLVNGYKDAGKYMVVFNGLNLPSGVYIYRHYCPTDLKHKCYKLLLM